MIPPGEDNPLGEYAIYLGLAGLSDPRHQHALGHRSANQPRLHPHVSRGYRVAVRSVPIGTQVTVVDQPVKLGWKDGELYIEVQPSTMQIDKMEETSRSPGPPDPIPLAEQADRS